LSLHLHEPHAYRKDQGQRWIDAANQDSRLSLVVDVQDPHSYTLKDQVKEQGEVLFRCNEELASTLIEGWHLPLSIADLTEMPLGTAVARLPGGVAALEVKQQ
jgi:hypothetical protein